LRDGCIVVTSIPKPPRGLNVAGRTLWKSILDDFELSEHERSLLHQACRTVDSLDALQGLLDVEGLTSESSQGVRIHPALAELRQQRITLAKLFAALHLPKGEDERTGQYRGPRGVYGIGGAS
jgi:hypothetical protein